MFLLNEINLKCGPYMNSATVLWDEVDEDDADDDNDRL